MKKACYLIGAVGAAIPALGLLVPATQAAAASAHPARPGAKSVSQRLAVGVTRAAVAAATSSSSSISPATNGCNGHTKVHAKVSGSMSTKFWYTNGTGSGVCIGTVIGNAFDGGGNPQDVFRVRIYSGTGSHKRKAYDKSVGGTIHSLNDTYAHQAIHRKFGYSAGHPIQVCAAWVDTGGIVSPTYSLIAGPLCRSVN